MNAADRVLLLDLENLGTARLHPRPLRARLDTLLATAGKIHHAVAAYALADGVECDPLVSLLAELRIAPLRVPSGPDAAELALLAHARHVHTEGGRIFLVGSADARLAELAALGRVQVLMWEGQPVSARLSDVVHDIHRMARPTSTSAEGTSPSLPLVPELPPPRQSVATVRSVEGEPRLPRTRLGERLLAAAVTGVAVAAGQRLFDAVLPRWRR